MLNESPFESDHLLRELGVDFLAAGLHNCRQLVLEGVPVRRGKHIRNRGHTFVDAFADNPSTRILVLEIVEHLVKRLARN